MLWGDISLTLLLIYTNLLYALSTGHVLLSKSFVTLFILTNCVLCVPLHICVLVHVCIVRNCLILFTWVTSMCSPVSHWVVTPWRQVLCPYKSVLNNFKSIESYTFLTPKKLIQCDNVYNTTCIIKSHE